jgi:hypothetical protein
MEFSPYKTNGYAAIGRTTSDTAQDAIEHNDISLPENEGPIHNEAARGIV